MSGRVYVQVGGNVSDGNVMLLAGSGGNTEVSAWLEWTNTGGFTDQGWDVAWKYPDLCTLPNAWALNPEGDYEPTESGFIKYMSTTPPQNLDKYLDNAGWTHTQKLQFIVKADLWTCMRE